MGSALGRRAHREPRRPPPGGITGRIRHSPAYAAELRAARSLGISRSVLLGRSLNERTTYTRDDTGAVTEAVTTRDPLFTEQDTDEALALEEFEQENCPGCGLPKVETFDPDNEWAYEGDTLACHACSARRRAEHQIDNLDGIFSFVTKREGRADG